MLLEVQDLNTFYGTSHVLQGISLTVEQGELVALLGRNGMGKSTTLKSIMGVVRAKSGSVVFKGKNICGYPSYRVARFGIGYVPEERRIFPNLSVAGKPAIWESREEKLETLMIRTPGQWKGSFSISPCWKKGPSRKGGILSGGEQQMLTIGRSLMGNPDLLLVDEPTEGLSPLMVKEVRDVLAEINKAGVSILLVEHNLKVAMSLAHRLYLMGKAHVGFTGTVDELKANPEARAKYLEV